MPYAHEKCDLASLVLLAAEQAKVLDPKLPPAKQLAKTAVYQSCPKEVQALLEAAVSLTGVFAFASRPTMADFTQKWYAWENYFQFLHNLREVCRRKQLRKDIYDRNIKMPRMRFEAIKALLARLFTVYPRVLTIRVDLKYRPAYAQEVSFSDLRKHVQMVAESARLGKNLFKSCLGFALRMEDAQDTGLHSHWVFFFDGGKRYRDLHIAKQICHWWCTEVTQGKGLAWNVNQYWRQQIDDGKVAKEDYDLGMVDRLDEKRVLGMASALRYLCHPGQDVLYKPSKNARTFWVKELV